MVHVPFPPDSPLTHEPVLEPPQLPCTSTPSTRLCFQSCTATTTVAVQLVPLLTAPPVRLPTWTLGAFTLIPIAPALLLELASASICRAIRVCPAIATSAVFQGKSSVTLAPPTRPLTVCVPMVVPAVGTQTVNGLVGGASVTLDFPWNT